MRGSIVVKESRAAFSAILLLHSNVCGLKVIGADPSLARFSYQGSLSRLGQSLQGKVDLRFIIRDREVSGTALGTNSFEKLDVEKGLFQVSLDFGMAVFTGAPRWLEISVREPGGNAYSILTPTQPLGVNPYAITALQVAEGSVGTLQIALNSVNGDLIAPGSVRSLMLAPGSVLDNLRAIGQTGVSKGGTIHSENYDNGGLVGAGYVQSGKVDLEDAWDVRNGATAPSARREHTAVWTGSEMIVWGVGIPMGYLEREDDMIPPPIVGR